MTERAASSSFALARPLLEVAFATAVGAGVVSVLQEHPRVLAMALALVALAYPFRRGLRAANAASTATAFFLMSTTGVIGYLTEAWGTTHGHWTYNHLPPGQTVPLWVPLAWALAGVLLQRLDRTLLDPGWVVPRRLGAAYAFGFFFPLLGESICIANGVWAYHWPLKILGVPLLALLLIAYAHVAFHLMHQGIERREATPRAADPLPSPRSDLR